MKIAAPPRSSVLDLIVMTAAAAVLCRFPATAYLMLPIIALAAPRSSDASRRRRLVFSALVFLPALIGLRLDCGHCRESWIRYGGIIPGVVLPLCLRRFAIGDAIDGPISFGLAAIFTLGLIVGGAAIAGRSRRLGILAGVAASGESLASYVLFFFLIRL